MGEEEWEGRERGGDGGRREGVMEGGVREGERVKAEIVIKLAKLSYTASDNSVVTLS